jgi:membrane protein DedA with SNARE-associated domain
LIRELAQTLLGLFHIYQLPTLLLAIFVEEAGIPIPVPGDTLVMLAGTETPHTLGHGLTVVGVASVAVFLGSSVLFLVVHRGGRPLLARYGKYILLDERRLQQMEDWFCHHGRPAVILGRLIPGLRIPTTIMAGISGLPYHEYALTAAIAALIWSTFYYLVGNALGRAAPIVVALVADVMDDVPRWLLVVSVLIVASGVLGAVAWRIQQVERPPAEGTPIADE